MLGIITAPSVKKQPPQDFEVWEENWDIFVMFRRMTTQWTPSFGGVIGLNMQSLEWFCRVYKIEDEAAMIEGIQVMEDAALAIINKRKE